MDHSRLVRAVRHALRTSLRTSLPVAFAALAAPPLLGQEAASDDMEVVVTGSRIRQETGMTTPVPVTTVNTQELQTLNPGAALTDQLSRMPQLVSTESAQRSSGALFGNAGGSYVNLRGLESKRTLVLLDGSRLVPNDRGGVVNIGTLPTGLIKSVDIVTGGASAQYGADAVGGVVNFVLDRDFNGLKFSSSTGITQEGDGWNVKGSVAGGFSLGEKLHVVASAEALSIDQIQRDPEGLDRDWFRRWGYVTNPAWTALPAAQRATSGVPQRLTLPYVISATHSPTGLITSPNPGFAFNRYTFTDNGTNVRPFRNGAITSISGAGSTQSMAGSTEFEAADRAFSGGPYGAQVKERSAFVGLKYDVTDRVQLIGQALLGISESNQPDQRGNPHLQDIWFATIYQDNAFLPANVRSEMQRLGLQSITMNKLGQWLGYKNWNDDEMAKNEHTMFTWSVGVEADLWTDWTGRLNWQRGKAHKYTAVFDELRVDRMFLALDAVRANPADPNSPIVCRSTRTNPNPTAAQLQAAVTPVGRLDKFGNLLKSPVGNDGSIQNCVPLNAFGQGQVSEAARDYLVGDKVGLSDVHQSFAELLLTGTLMEGWAGPIGAAVGGTYRKQSLQQAAYPENIEELGPPINAPSLGIQGIPGGFSGGSPNLFQFSTVPRIGGEYDVWEVFGEIQVPLWQSSGGEQRVDADLAYRRSEYATGAVQAYKGGLDFQVFADLRLRGTYSRDVREATFAERFDFQGSGGSVTDPSFGNASFQITSVAVGNPDVNPEKADTFTFGAIYQPSWASGLQLSADWYKVEIEGAIAQLGLQRVVDDCSRGNTILCQYVERDTAGVIARVRNPYLNLANGTVEGVDVEGQYRLKTDWFSDQDETFTVRTFVARILERSNQATTGAAVLRYEGGFDGTGAGLGLIPKWKGNLSVGYEFGPWGVQVIEEWISKSKINTTWVEGRDVDDNTLPNYFNTNVRLSYGGTTEGGADWDVSLFVSNALDKHPMVIPSYNSRGGSQTVSNNYDAFGRRFDLGFRYQF